jgi:REP element-mobilizing transposase RayT
MRGVNKQNIFEDDTDKKKFFKVLQFYKDVSNFQIYAYCLMSNHIHLLIREVNEPISISIQRISSSYVRWYNDKYDRCGHLFQERFKSEAVEDDCYFLTVIRYIHQNPVKAGILKDSELYKWSSLNEYLLKPVIVNVEYALECFSDNNIKALSLFRQFSHQNNDDDSLLYGDRMHSTARYNYKEPLDYNDKVRMSDREVVNAFVELGVANISELQKMDKQKRDEFIKKVKEKQGVSIRQLARITGLAKSIVDRL